MTKRNKLWAIETVDGDGHEGVDILLARTEEEARARHKKMWHLACDCQITSCESILGMSLVEIRGQLGETNYFETYRQSEDGQVRTVGECPRGPRDEHTTSVDTRNQITK